jgi:hypothetical protein
MFSTAVPLKLRFCADCCSKCRGYTLPSTHEATEHGTKLHYQCRECLHHWYVSWNTDVAAGHSTSMLLFFLEDGIKAWNLKNRGRT